MKQHPLPARQDDQWQQRVADNGWLWNPAPARSDGSEPPCLILAHGAGAPMDSDFMQTMAERLAVGGVSVLRFEFPYMALRREQGGKRPPDRQPTLLESWRQVYSLVRPLVGGKLAIGGKSMGGRMASLVADELRADALVSLGYPFYAVGKPEKPRVEHLAELRTPALIVQGERDALGNAEAVAQYELSEGIEVFWLASGDHDLKPLKASGYRHADHLQTAVDRIAAFLA
ncbi:alpha/beta family hydrolase [Pseudomonas sp. dw_358]|uniref:alpha/beta family hydrolase n=1 Tax=Pseudomonas sp. dw_358 TaxID=2720083 RepID=UPI001BD4F1E0|nr:alpha/beta family hydrolase [Pseudomonas sp. dw_358]